MNDLLTQKGLEIETLSLGDIVTKAGRLPGICDNGIYQVEAINGNAVVMLSLNPNLVGTEFERETTLINAWRFFEASDLAEAMYGEKGK